MNNCDVLHSDAVVLLCMFRYVKHRVRPCEHLSSCNINLIQNSQAVKKCAALKKAMVKKM